MKPFDVDELVARVGWSQRMLVAVPTTSRAGCAVFLAAANTSGGEVVVSRDDTVGRVFFQEGCVGWAHLSTRPITMASIFEDVAKLCPDEVREVMGGVQARGSQLRRSARAVGSGQRGRGNRRSPGINPKHGGGHVLAGSPGGRVRPRGARALAWSEVRPFRGDAPGDNASPPTPSRSAASSGDLRRTDAMSVHATMQCLRRRRRNPGGRPSRERSGRRGHRIPVEWHGVGRCGGTESMNRHRSSQTPYLGRAGQRRGRR